MVMYHDTLYDAYNSWCNSLVNIPYKMHKRKFQSEVFRLQSRLGLDYLGSEKNPAYTRWLITDKEKWKSIQFIEDEDELSTDTSTATPTAAGCQGGVGGEVGEDAA